MSATSARVVPGSFLTLHYRLAGPAGDVVNTFGGKPATLTLGSGELAPGIEAALIGLEEGAHHAGPASRGVRREEPGHAAVAVAQGTARAGDPNEEYRVGDVVQFPTPDRQGQFGGVVVQTGELAVLFDFNHPLAGQPVTFEVQLIGVL